ncbi:MAG: hypothetical protein AABX70_09060 [Nanoarchaeota archaeon]
MRNPLRQLGLAGLAALALASPARTQDNPSIDLGLSLANPYLVSRGFQPSDELNLQPSIDLIVPVEKGKVTFGYWGDFNKDGRFETDWTITYNCTLGKVPHLGALTGQVALNQYNVPDLKLEEWNGSVQLSDHVLAPKVFVAADFRDGKGNVAELSVNPHFKLGPLNLDTTLAALYNDHYATDRSGWSGIRADVSAPFKIAPGTTLTLGARFFHATRDDFEDHTAFKATLSHHFDLSRTPK